MTRLGMERQSAGKMPAVLKTAEESIRLDAGGCSNKKRKTWRCLLNR
jgi:hypothetical protein